MIISNYRPQKYSDIYGQDVPVKILSRMSQEKEIYSPILISGPNGCGKTSLAKIFLSEISASYCEINAAMLDDQKILEIMDEYTFFLIEDVELLRDEVIPYLQSIWDLGSTVVITTSRKNKVSSKLISSAFHIDISHVSVPILLELVKKVFEEKDISYTDADLQYCSGFLYDRVRDSLIMLDKVLLLGGFNKDNIDTAFKQSTTGVLQDILLSLSSPLRISKLVHEVLVQIPVSEVYDRASTMCLNQLTAKTGPLYDMYGGSLLSIAKELASSSIVAKTRQELLCDILLLSVNIRDISKYKNVSLISEESVPLVENKPEIKLIKKEAPKLYNITPQEFVEELVKLGGEIYKPPV